MKSQTKYCGIDIGLRNHAVCLIDENQVVLARFSIKNCREGFEKLEKQISNCTKICLEPTGVYSVNLFLYFRNQGFDIRFCDTRSSKKFRESMFGSKKHDRLDCISLAKYRIVHEDLTFDRLNFIEKQELVFDNRFSNLQNLVDSYKRKSKELTKVKNKIKFLIDLRFPEAIQIFSKDRASKSIITVLQHSKSDVLSGNIDVKKFDEIKKFLRDSIGQYDMMVDDFKDLVKEQEKLESELKFLREEMGKEIENLGYNSLLNYCGFSITNLAIILSEVKNVDRFFMFNKDGSLNKKKSLRLFKGYIGLSTTSNQSGERDGGCRMVSAGNKNLKSVLYLLALTYISLDKVNECNVSDDFNPYRYREIYEFYIKKKPKMIGVVKVMSKIATDLLFLFKKVEDQKVSRV